MGWTVSLLDNRVEDEFEQQPADIKVHFLVVVDQIERFGPSFGTPAIKHLQGPLWEMRLRGRDGIARAIYVTVRNQRVVVVRVFTKKTQKTPKDEIRLALKRAREVQE